MKRIRSIAAILIFGAVIGFVVVKTASREAGKALADKTVCIKNLMNIEGAEEVWAKEKGKTTNDVPIMTDLTNYLGRILKCPSGGTYTLGTVGENPKCTIKGHVLP